MNASSVILANTALVPAPLTIRVNVKLGFTVETVPTQLRHLLAALVMQVSALLDPTAPQILGNRMNANQGSTTTNQGQLHHLIANHVMVDPSVGRLG